MPYCFITYAKNDRRLADAAYDELQRHKLSAFMAAVSIEPGQHWSPKILANLRNSNWVILLASRTACTSPYVNQEIGGALTDSKTLVPILLDIAPEELPGWARGVQAIDLRHAPTPENIREQVATIANRIKRQRKQAFMILAFIIAAVWLLGDDEPSTAR